MSERTLTAVLHKEDDLFVAECPEVGTVSQRGKDAVTHEFAWEPHRSCLPNAARCFS